MMQASIESGPGKARHEGVRGTQERPFPAGRRGTETRVVGALCAMR